jgi:hypothetical protein
LDVGGVDAPGGTTRFAIRDDLLMAPMSARPPRLELERIEGLRRRLFVLALSPFEPSGATDTITGARPATDRMAPLGLHETPVHQNDVTASTRFLLS